MKSTSFVKATLLGGILFLVPIVMLLVVIGKIVPLIIRLDRAVIGAIPPDSFIGSVILHLVALGILVFILFLVGIAAQSQPGRKIMRTLEESVLGAMPGYNFFKGFTQSMDDSNQIAESFRPVVVHFDDMSQVAFEIERIETNGKVVIYLPGAPNPWSGSVVYVDPERVDQLNLTVPQVVRNIRMLGKESSDIRDEAMG